MENKIGMNLLLWGTVMDEKMFPILEELKEIGFDGVEIPIFNVDPNNWYAWRKILDDLQLESVAVTINGADFNQIDKDLSQRKATLERNKRAVDCAVILNSNLLTGPFHSALGVFTGHKPSQEEKKWAKESLWELAEYADSMGLVLGLEYLNRFESYLVSSSDELLDLIQEINHPACKMMFDTFHANIEEKNVADAILKIDQNLIHVQLSENDRGTLGQGHIDFEAIIKTLYLTQYKGMISIEAFSEKLSAANIWRKMFDSEMQLAKDSFELVKSLMMKLT